MSSSWAWSSSSWPWSSSWAWSSSSWAPASRDKCLVIPSFVQEPLCLHQFPHTYHLSSLKQETRLETIFNFSAQVWEMFTIVPAVSFQQDFEETAFSEFFGKISLEMWINFSRLDRSQTCHFCIQRGEASKLFFRKYSGIFQTICSCGNFQECEEKKCSSRIFQDGHKKPSP